MYRHKWKRAWIGGVCGALLRTLIHDNSRHHQTICRNFVFCLFHLQFLRKWLFFPHLHNVDLRANDGSRWRVTLEGGHSLPRWSWSEGIWVSHSGAGGECAVVCKGNVQEKCSVRRYHVALLTWLSSLRCHLTVSCSWRGWPLTPGPSSMWKSIFTWPRQDWIAWML